MDFILIFYIDHVILYYMITQKIGVHFYSEIRENIYKKIYLCNLGICLDRQQSQIRHY